MNCNEVREWIPLGIGDDAPVENEAFEQHLAACADCAAEYEAYEQNLARLVSVREAPEPDGLYEAMWRNVQKGIRQKPATVHRFPVQLRFAAMFLVGIFGGFAAIQFMLPTTGSDDVDALNASDVPQERIHRLASPAVNSTESTETLPMDPKHLASLRAQQAAARAKVGLNVSRVHPVLIKQIPELSGNGAMVYNVATGSAADAAGLELYDVVLEFNGTAITDSGQLHNHLHQSAGSVVKLGVLRGGKRIEVQLVVPTVD
jgi:membrane-associated protease RseP (regulator of RpoE activity)